MLPLPHQIPSHHKVLERLGVTLKFLPPEIPATVVEQQLSEYNQAAKNGKAWARSHRGWTWDSGLENGIERQS